MLRDTCLSTWSMSGVLHESLPEDKLSELPEAAHFEEFGYANADRFLRPTGNKVSARVSKTH